MKYVCEIELNPDTVKRFGYRYHGNVPILGTFIKKTGLGYWLHRLGQWIAKARKEPATRPQTETTSLVMQAPPAVLSEIALQLYGMAVPGESVENTIVSASSSKCQSKNSPLV